MNIRRAPGVRIGDLVAGLLVAALAIPQALGYAAVAGVPVQVGLYTLPPALLGYAFLGSCRILYVGPVSTVTVISGSIVRVLSNGDVERATALTSALAIVAGVILIGAAALRLGWVARFLSEPIVTGFVAGLVVLIVVGEIPGLLGLERPIGALFDQIISVTRDLDQIHPASAVIGLGALAILALGTLIAPRLPWSLLVLVAAIVISDRLALDERGVAVVGTVPSGFPLPSIPSITVTDLTALLSGGIAIAAVGIAEGLAAARTFAGNGREADPGGGDGVSEARPLASNQEPPLDPDREFLATGAANVASGFFGGMGVAGSLSKTAANARAGATSRWSSIISAVVVLAVVVGATGLLHSLPRAALAAIVIHAVWSLVRPGTIRRYAQIRRNDFVAALMALGGVLVLGPIGGLLLAVGQSLLGLVYRSMQVNVDEMGRIRDEKAAWGAIAHDPTRVPVPGIIVLRPDGPIFWANAEPVLGRIERIVARHDETKALILDLEASNQFDTSTADLLLAMLKRLKARGLQVHFVRVFDRVEDVLVAAGVLDVIGEDRIWHSISAAVKAAKRSMNAAAADAAAADAAAADAAATDADTDRDEERVAPRRPTRSG